MALEPGYPGQDYQRLGSDTEKSLFVLFESTWEELILFLNLFDRVYLKPFDPDFPAICLFKE